jgi:hypothetical protein
MIRIIRAVVGQKTWEVGPNGYPPIVVIDDDIKAGGFTTACNVPVIELTTWTKRRRPKISDIVTMLRSAKEDVLLVTKKAAEICLQLLAGSEFSEVMTIHLSTCRHSGFTVEINDNQLISFKKD